MEIKGFAFSHEYFDQFLIETASFVDLKITFRILSLVLLKVYIKTFVVMKRNFAWYVPIRIPPGVKNLIFTPHGISDGDSHWNIQYPWFSQVSWDFPWAWSIGFPRRYLCMVSWFSKGLTNSINSLKCCEGLAEILNIFDKMMRWVVMSCHKWCGAGTHYITH